MRLREQADWRNWLLETVEDDWLYFLCTAN